jgi:glycine cleavage system aminomethyltransferase T
MKFSDFLSLSVAVGNLGGAKVIVLQRKTVTGELGFEPRQTESESAIYH